jgi:hypothetical protein
MYKKNQSRTHKAGFMLLEILLAIALIAGFATMVLPRIRDANKNVTWVSVTASMNRLLQWTRQQAIADRTIYRIIFVKRSPKERDFLQVEHAVQNPEKPNEKIWQPLTGLFFETKLELPEQIELVAAYQDHVEQFEEHKNQAHIHVMHEGLAQEILLHLIKKTDTAEKTMEKGTLQLEPFLGIFSFEAGFTPVKKERR